MVVVTPPPSAQLVHRIERRPTGLFVLLGGTLGLMAAVALSTAHEGD